MNFCRIRPVFQKLLKVCSVTYAGHITVHKITTEKLFEIRAYIKGNVGLNISASHIYSELCQIYWTSVVPNRSISIWYKPLKMAKVA